MRHLLFFRQIQCNLRRSTALVLETLLRHFTFPNSEKQHLQVSGGFQR